MFFMIRENSRFMLRLIYDKKIYIAVVPVAGIEPALPKESDFESDVSTNFTTLAQQKANYT